MEEYEKNGVIERLRKNENTVREYLEMMNDGEFDRTYAFIRHGACNHDPDERLLKLAFGS